MENEIEGLKGVSPTWLKLFFQQKEVSQEIVK